MATDEAVLDQETEEGSDYTRAEQVHYHAILEREKEVAKLFDKMSRAKERAKAAKDAWEAASSELHEFIRGGPDQQPKLPGMEDTDIDPEGWRKVSLEDAGLTGKLLKPFAESDDPDIETLGELADFTSEYALTDIRGIGPKLAEEIEDALDKFWAEHPEYPQPTTEEAVDGGDA